MALCCASTLNVLLHSRYCYCCCTATVTLNFALHRLQTGRYDEVDYNEQAKKTRDKSSHEGATKRNRIQWG